MAVTVSFIHLIQSTEYSLALFLITPLLYPVTCLDPNVCHVLYIANYCVAWLQAYALLALSYCASILFLQIMKYPAQKAGKLCTCLLGVCWCMSEVWVHLSFWCTQLLNLAVIFVTCTLYVLFSQCPQRNRSSRPLTWWKELWVDQCACIVCDVFAHSAELPYV